MSRADGARLFEPAVAPRTRVEAAAPFFQSRQSVRVHRELLAGSPKSLRLDLAPGKPEQGIVERVYTTAAGDRVVAGKLRGRPGSAFTLVVHGEEVAGDFTVSTSERYQLRGSALRQADPLARLHCAGAESPLVSPRTRSAAAPVHRLSADDPAQFDVLIVYTPAARISAGGTAAMEAAAALAVESVNAAYANSGINTRARLVHAEEVNYVESGSSAVDLAHLSAKTDGVMDEVHALRDLWRADVVSLFVDRLEPNVAGMASLAVFLTDGQPDPEPDQAFSVVLASQASPTALAHEIGHNFGCQHDLQNASVGPQFFPYGYGWRFVGADGTQYHTVMAYEPGQAIPYFSSPLVRYQGVPTGVDGTADNARIINENAALLADFRTDRLVIVTATGPLATESPAANGHFTFMRTGSADEPLTVTYTLGGTATNGVDYQTLPCSIVIPAGAATADLEVAPIDDGDAEGAESVTVTVTDGDRYIRGPVNHAAVLLRDSPVDVSLTVSGLNEFSVSRTGALDQPLAVSCRLRGSATINRDYRLDPAFVVTGEGYSGIVIIPAGAAAVTLPVTPLPKSAPLDMLIVELAGSDSYQPGDPSDIAIYLNDPPAAQVFVTALDPAAAQQPADPATFRFTRTGPADAPLEVDFNLGGAAQVDLDYQIGGYTYFPAATPGGAIVYSLIIPAGAASADLTVTPTANQFDAAAKDVRVNVTAPLSGAGYTVTPPAGTASAVIAGVPTGMAPMFMSGSGATGLVGQPFVFQLLANNAPAQYDAAGLPAWLALDPGTGLLSGVPTEPGVFPVTISASNGAGAGSSALVITIADAPGLPEVNITATIAQAFEAGRRKGECTITRTGDLSADLTVYYAVKGTAGNGAFYKPLSGQATIPAGADSTRLKIKPFEDGVKTGNHKAKFVLQPDAAYQVGANSLAKVTILDAD